MIPTGTWRVGRSDRSARTTPERSRTSRIWWSRTSSAHSARERRVGIVVRIGHLTVGDPHKGFARSSVRRGPAPAPVRRLRYRRCPRGWRRAAETSIAEHPGVGRRSSIARTMAVANHQRGRCLVEESAQIVGCHVHRTGLINHDDSPVMRATHAEGSTMIVAHESAGIAQHRTRRLPDATVAQRREASRASSPSPRPPPAARRLRSGGRRPPTSRDRRKARNSSAPCGHSSARRLGEQSRQHQSRGRVPTRHAGLIELRRAEQARLAREDRERAFAHGTQCRQPRRVARADPAQELTFGARAEHRHVEAQRFCPLARLREPPRTELLAAVAQLREVKAEATDQDVHAQLLGALQSARGDFVERLYQMVDARTHSRVHQLVRANHACLFTSAQRNLEDSIVQIATGLAARRGAFVDRPRSPFVVVATGHQLGIDDAHATAPMRRASRTG